MKMLTFTLFFPKYKTVIFLFMVAACVAMMAVKIIEKGF